MRPSAKSRPKSNDRKLLPQTEPNHLEGLQEQRSAAAQWDHDAARRALDELFKLTKTFNSSKAYLQLMEFIARFRLYSPFNAMLIYTQMPGARFVATPRRWMREFYREIKAAARPIVILQPKGPVLFVFDISDTESLPGAPPVPDEALNPFAIGSGNIRNQLEHTIKNAKRDGVRITEVSHGSQRAGPSNVHLAFDFLTRSSACRCGTNSC